MKVQDQSSLRQVVKDWINAYERRDKTLITKLFLDTQDSFHYGTGVDEKIVGMHGMMNQLDRDWAQSEGAKLELAEFRCEAFFHQFAWIVCELIPHITIEGKVHRFPPLRSTLVVVRDHESKPWKIAHCHASFPFGEQNPGQSFPTV